MMTVRYSEHGVSTVEECLRVERSCVQEPDKVGYRCITGALAGQDIVMLAINPADLN